MYVCRVRVAAWVRTLSFSFFSFLRRSSSLEEELELLSLSLELEPGIRSGSDVGKVARLHGERRVGDLWIIRAHIECTGGMGCGNDSTYLLPPGGRSPAKRARGSRIAS
jgi:hypothetical protein